MTRPMIVAEGLEKHFGTTHALRGLDLDVAEGTILDPFMGSGSTIAAAAAVGSQSIGIEQDREYFQMANAAIPELARLSLGELGANGPKE